MDNPHTSLSSSPSRTSTGETTSSEVNQQYSSPSTTTTTTTTDTKASSSSATSASTSDSASASSSSIITTLQQNVSSLAGPQFNLVKDAVNENIVPVASEALQSTQSAVREIIRKVSPESEAEPQKGLDPSHPDYKYIEQMPDEQICDFLRYKHRSTAPEPLRNE
ncbi:hypothetical protein POX_b02326 [Penicillium oxalicum]|uniref:hypothetical protein n=1 Tax=Penicillium oxalicum TaxID=69781 RepID=UPI0020B8EF77|nr:hypothetical protein POX_b02326 [Penicillium oxalicum]KAI2792289.1 hypothetical protein POX_b02326 [Penicillium oxalicum]